MLATSSHFCLFFPKGGCSLRPCVCMRAGKREARRPGSGSGSGSGSGGSTSAVPELLLPEQRHWGSAGAAAPLLRSHQGQEGERNTGFPCLEPPSPGYLHRRQPALPLSRGDKHLSVHKLNSLWLICSVRSRIVRIMAELLPADHPIKRNQRLLQRPSQGK